MGSSFFFCSTFGARGFVFKCCILCKSKLLRTELISQAFAHEKFANLAQLHVCLSRRHLASISRQIVTWEVWAAAQCSMQPWNPKDDINEPTKLSSRDSSRGNEKKKKSSLAQSLTLALKLHLLDLLGKVGCIMLHCHDMPSLCLCWFSMSSSHPLQVFHFAHPFKLERSRHPETKDPRHQTPEWCG